MKSFKLTFHIFLPKSSEAVPRKFCGEAFLKNLANLAGKHLCQSPFFMIVAVCKDSETVFESRPKMFFLNFEKLSE